MHRCSVAAPSSSLPLVECTRAPPRARLATASSSPLPVSRLSVTAARRFSRPASIAPALTAASPDSMSARIAEGRAVVVGAGRTSIRAASTSSRPGSTPSSRRNRSVDAASCRWTATSSRVAAKVRMSRTCASSSSGDAVTSRVASATPARAFPDAIARRAPSRSTASPSPRRRRRSPSNHAEKPGDASTSTPSRSSRPSPGSSTASSDVPAISTFTSIVDPTGSRSCTTLALPTVSGPPSNLRSSERFHRSAPAGSSASGNKRSMS